MKNQGTGAASAKIGKEKASSSHLPPSETRYRRDDKKAMHLRDNMRGFGSQQNETLARINRLEEKLEQRKQTSRKMSSKQKTEKDLEAALDSLMKSVGKGKLLD